MEKMLISHVYGLVYSRQNFYLKFFLRNTWKLYHVAALQEM